MLESSTQVSNQSGTSHPRYKQEKLLGTGAFGKAYLVREIETGNQFVIKQINLDDMSPTEQENAQREAKILKELDHPNIIKFKEVYRSTGKTGSKLNIVMEYADGGDLAQKIAEAKAGGKVFSEKVILDWFTQICLGLKHIHDRKIIHRDLKGQNIFLTKQGIVKIGDFGVSRVLEQTQAKARTIVGSPYYLSPEIIENRPYSTKTDIWSLGALLFQLCTLEPPFTANNLQFLALKIVKGSFANLPTRYSSELRGLIKLMLNTHANQRPTVNTILTTKLLTSRIKEFLTESQNLHEFSHTVLHKKKEIIKPPPNLKDNSSQLSFHSCGLNQTHRIEGGGEQNEGGSELIQNRGEKVHGQSEKHHQQSEKDYVSPEVIGKIPGKGRNVGPNHFFQRNQGLPQKQKQEYGELADLMLIKQTPLQNQPYPKYRTKPMRIPLPPKNMIHKNEQRDLTPNPSGIYHPGHDYHSEEHGLYKEHQHHKMNPADSSGIHGHALPIIHAHPNIPSAKILTPKLPPRNNSEVQIHGNGMAEQAFIAGKKPLETLGELEKVKKAKQGMKMMKAVSGQKLIREKSGSSKRLKKETKKEKIFEVASEQYKKRNPDNGDHKPKKICPFQKKKKTVEPRMPLPRNDVGMAILPEEKIDHQEVERTHSASQCAGENEAESNYNSRLGEARTDGFQMQLPSLSKSPVDEEYSSDFSNFSDSSQDQMEVDYEQDVREEIIDFSISDTNHGGLARMLEELKDIHKRVEAANGVVINLPMRGKGLSSAEEHFELTIKEDPLIEIPAEDPEISTRNKKDENQQAEVQNKERAVEELEYIMNRDKIESLMMEMENIFGLEALKPAYQAIELIVRENKLDFDETAAIAIITNSAPKIDRKMLDKYFRLLVTIVALENEG